MWGQVDKNILDYFAERIIPTRVGTRLHIFSMRGASWDHPHACGDKGRTRYRDTPCQGSSPRVWGQGAGFNNAFITKGIIPTRVGTRTLSAVRFSGSQDHPHACGDKKDDQYLIVSAKGSSPRVWGQVTGKVFKAEISGIIPTRVGTSWA